MSRDISRHQMAQRYHSVRQHTEQLAASLSAEDQCVQSMPDASPAKWHRAHTTWFFEQFLLLAHLPGYRLFDDDFVFLFNSYYEAVGARHPRPQRGLLTRPDGARIAAYRAAVDTAMAELLMRHDVTHELLDLGLQHEQQHQELLLTDMLHAFAQNPLAPAVLPGWQDGALPGAVGFLAYDGGRVEIGHGGPGFAFDNETPRHAVLLRPFQLADHPVRNAEYLDFIEAGGYRDAALWMADGWAAVQEGGWQAPLYWQHGATGWQQMGPGGMQPLQPQAPVRHISWYEADAYARWADARLPTEAEWEYAAADAAQQGLVGHVWQWTASAYGPYPGFRPAGGAIGEYNGKFMINQMVLRGGSVATPAGHTRRSYRNFFHPDRRWQFTGLRLARDL